MIKEKYRKYVIRLLKIVFTILLIGYLFKSGYLTGESFSNLFKSKNIPFILLSSFAFIIAQILAAVRLLFLLRIIDFHIRTLQSFKLTWIGNFFNIVIPGTVGGDFVKAFYLIRNEEHNIGRSSGIVLTDRLLGLMAMLWLGLISIVYLLVKKSRDLNSYINGLYIVLMIIVSLFIFFIVFVIFGKNQYIRNSFKKFFATLFGKSVFYSMADGIGIFAKNSRILVPSLLISLSIQLISIAGLLNLVNVVDEIMPNIVTLIAVSFIVMLLAVIPVTPGNLGWTELIAAFGWSSVGSNVGAEIFVYWRIITVLCSLPGGLLYLFRTHEFKQNAKG